MARSRFMLSSAVVLDDKHLAMSPGAQALDVILNAEADVTGKVIGIQRIVRGSGLGLDALAELYENGFLLKTGDGDTYITHMWQHNKYDKRLWERMSDCLPYTSGELVFVGDEGRSAYRLAQNVDESSLFHRSYVDAPSRNSNGKGNSNSTETEKQGKPNSKETETQGDGEHGEGGGVRKTPCPRCGTMAVVEHELGVMKVDCGSCGFYTVDENGEIIG